MQPKEARYMSALSTSPTWRNFLRDIAVAGALCIFLLAVQSHAQTGRNAIAEDSVSNSLPAKPPAATEDKAIRPFRVKIPEEALVDLRRRLAATRWPDQETVTDQSQGAQLAMMKELVRYWQTDYDWRKAEAKLNAMPQFVTTIDGEDIYFIHVRSPHPNAMPLIMTHGWPGSVIELLNIVDPLTNP